MNWNAELIYEFNLWVLCIRKTNGPFIIECIDQYIQNFLKLRIGEFFSNALYYFY